MEYDPTSELRYYGRAIRDALDPARSPGKVRTMKDMSEEELKALKAKLEKK